MSTHPKSVRSRRNRLFPLGVDYPPYDAEGTSPEEWYTGDFDADLEACARARITLVRIFISWRAFEPQVGVYSDEATSRLGELLESAGAHRLQLIISFFGGEPQACLAGVVWGRDKDPHTDAYLIERQAALIGHVVESHRNDRAVFGWELANEAFCGGFQSAAEMASWVTTMREAVREHDADRPVMLGADDETLFCASGIDTREMLAGCEVGIVHATPRYRSYIAEGSSIAARSTYLDSYLLHHAKAGRPLLLDGVGPHTLEGSLGEEGALVRSALYSAAMNGASGALVCRWRDKETEWREPYHLGEHDAVVGLHDAEGNAKPSMHELQSFARMVAGLDLQALARPFDRVAVLVPAERMAVPPTLVSLYAPRASLEAFVRAKEAHLPVTVVREHDALDPYAMIIVPSAASLVEATWQRLSSWVQRGGSLVFSYGGGELAPVAGELLGVDFLGDDGPRTEAACRIAQRDVLGALAPFEVPIAVPHFALLAAGAATVLATDQGGNPLITLNRLGQGRAVFVAAPFERMLGQSGLHEPPRPLAAFLRTLYGAVGRVSGCEQKVACDAFEVEVALLSGDDGDVLLLLNHYARDVTATVRFDRLLASVTSVAGGRSVDVGGKVFGVPLGPFGASALRIVYG